MALKLIDDATLIAIANKVREIGGLPSTTKMSLGSEADGILTYLGNLSPHMDGFEVLATGELILPSDNTQLRIPHPLGVNPNLVVIKRKEGTGAAYSAYSELHAIMLSVGSSTISVYLNSSNNVTVGYASSGYGITVGSQSILASTHNSSSNNRWRAATYQWIAARTTN